MNELTRRDCGKLLAGLAAGVWAGQLPAAPKPSPFRLRYIQASCMYGTLKLDEILPQARPAGCEVVDIWPKPHGNQREQLEEMGADAFAERLRKHNLALGVLTRYDLGPFRLADEFKLLKRLGGRMIVCGGAGPYDVKDRKSVV